jgi:predicted NUDIX family NTP pyrophosphohydrolase
MSVYSAGILLFRYRGDDLEVFLVHPGGPFWVNRNEGAWSIPKGLIEEGEQPLEAAKREFTEETGFRVDGRFVALGQLKMPSGKIVHAWALEQDVDASALRSNSFSLEWPKGSGIVQDYPEVDKGQWFGLDRAYIMISRGQLKFLERLVDRLGHRARASE